MRALVIEAPDRFSLAEVAQPSAARGDVVIEVLAGGICGTDVEILHGDMVYYTRGAAAYPVIPCHEWTGVVRALGEGVSHIAIGDRVVGEVSIGCLSCPVCLSGNYHRCADRTETGIMNRPGGFSERMVLPAAFVHKIASSVSLGSAALVEPTAVAYNGVLKAGVSPSDDVVIFGDGPIGLLLLQIVRLFGARKIAMVGAADSRLEIARKSGADAVIDARAGDIAGSVCRAFGGGRGSIVFEASGHPDAIMTALDVASPGARLVLQGFCGGRRIDGFNVDPIIVNDLTVIGALGSPRIWPEVIRLIEDGRLNPSAVITDVLPVSAFGEAIRRVEHREACKVILRTDLPRAWG